MKPAQLAKACKIVATHLGLVSVLVAYICAGAAVLLQFEADAELVEYRMKLSLLREAYENFSATSDQLCQSGTSELEFLSWTNQSLMEITRIHFNYYAPVLPNDIVTNSSLESFAGRWSFPASLLYVLGMLSTGGYSYLQLRTTFSKLFTIAYCLLGFPLLLVTCADVGVFLSEVVNWIYRKIRKEDQNTAAVANREQELQLASWTVLVSVLMVCCLGSFIFMIVYNWSFVDALFYAVNAITGVSLGDFPPSALPAAFITVAYVICGFAIVTMSINMAQTQIRHWFTQLHYFGRKLLSLKLNFDQDLQFMLKMFSDIRKRNPGKTGKINWEDMLDFIIEEEMTAKAKLAFCPNVSMLFVDESPKHRHSGRGAHTAIDVDGVQPHH